VKRPAFWRFSFCYATEKDTREEAGPVTGAAKFIDTSIARLWGVMGAREGGLGDFNPTFLSGAGVLPIQGESMSSTSPPEHSDMSLRIKNTCFDSRLSDPGGWSGRPHLSTFPSSCAASTRPSTQALFLKDDSTLELGVAVGHYHALKRSP
jgi:hypothetical protein